MTCIIGILDTETGEIVMGADSQRTMWGVAYPFSTKIRRHRNLYIAASGMCKVHAAIDSWVDSNRSDMTALAFVQHTFTPQFLPHILQRSTEDPLIIVSDGVSLFKVSVYEQSYLQPNPILNGRYVIVAAGSGEQFALGASYALLSMTERLPLRSVVDKALEAAGTYSPFVSPPFVVMGVVKQ